MWSPAKMTRSDLLIGIRHDGSVACVASSITVTSKVLFSISSDPAVELVVQTTSELAITSSIASSSSFLLLS